MPYKDKEKQRAYHQLWTQQNPGKVQAARLAYLQRYPERAVVLHEKRKQARNRRQKVRLVQDALYRAKRRQQIKQYMASHPESKKNHAAKRRARIAGAPVNDLTTSQWQAIKAHYGHRCVYCGKKFQRLTMDHLTPLSRGGSHTASNIVPACRPCNIRKGNRTVLCPVQPLLLASV